MLRKDREKTEKAQNNNTNYKNSNELQEKGR